METMITGKPNQKIVFRVFCIEIVIFWVNVAPQNLVLISLGPILEDPLEQFATSV